MNALSIQTKRLVGLVVTTAALAVVAAPSALATSGQAAPDHQAAISDLLATPSALAAGGQIAPDHWAANDQFATRANDPSLLRDRSTDRGTFVPQSDPSLFRDRSTDRGTFVPQSDPSLFRDRSTDVGGGARGPQLSAASAPVAEPVSGDGFQWADAGIGAVSVVGLMLMGLLAAVVVRRGRQEPKGA